MVLLIVLLVLTAFAVGIVLRPPTIIAFAFGVYCFEQLAQANSSFFGTRSAFMNLAFGVLTLLALLCVTMRGKNPLNPLTGSSLWFLALYLFAFASCMWSLDRDLSLFLFQYHMPYIVTFVFLLPMVLQDPDDINYGLIATLAFCSLVMALMMTNTQLHAYGRTIQAEIVDRVGQKSNRLAPLAVADMAGQVVIIAMLMNFRGIHRIWQQLRWPIVVLALAMIIRSESRGQFIAAVFAVVVLITVSRGTKSAVGWIAAAFSIVFVAAIAAANYIGAAGASKRWEVDQMGNTFANTRLALVTKLLSFWAESSPINWFLGLGSSASFDPRLLGQYPHVIAAEVLGELGFFGLFLFVGFLVSVSRDAFRLFQMTKHSDVQRGVTVTLIGLFIFQMILSCKQGSLISTTITWCVGLLISRHCALVRNTRSVELARDRRSQWYAWYQWQQQAQQAQEAQQLPSAEPTGG